MPTFPLPADPLRAGFEKAKEQEREATRRDDNDRKYRYAVQRFLTLMAEAGNPGLIPIRVVANVTVVASRRRSKPPKYVEEWRGAQAWLVRETKGIYESQTSGELSESWDRRYLTTEGELAEGSDAERVRTTWSLASNDHTSYWPLPEDLGGVLAFHNIEP